MRSLFGCGHALLVAIGVAATPLTALNAQPRATERSHVPVLPESALVFLRSWVYEGSWKDWVDGSDSTTTWYQAAAFTPGPGYSAAFVVHLVGRPWCGVNVGCETLVIARNASGYRVVGDFDRVHIPVSVLASRSHGWPDLTTWAWGAGRLTPRLGVMRFDGRHYDGDTEEGPRARREGQRILTDASRPVPLFPHTPPWPKVSR